MSNTRCSWEYCKFYPSLGIDTNIMDRVIPAQRCQCPDPMIVEDGGRDEPICANFKYYVPRRWRIKSQ